jgi:hypothetical protein
VQKQLSVKGLSVHLVPVVGSHLLVVQPFRLEPRLEHIEAEHLAPLRPKTKNDGLQKKLRICG